MTISKELFLSILSMDAYNRGYNAGIADGKGDVGTDADGNPIDRDGLGRIGSRIGSAVVVADENSKNAQSNGFYALAYDVDISRVEGWEGGRLCCTNGLKGGFPFSPDGVILRGQLWVCQARCSG